MKLITGWRRAWRLWSVRVPAIGATIFGLLLAAPDFLLSIWNSLPAEIQELIPNRTGFALVITGASMIARVVRQKGVADEA